MSYGLPKLELVNIEYLSGSKTGTAKQILIDQRVPRREYWKILAATVFIPGGGSTKWPLCQLAIGGGSNYLQLFTAICTPTVVSTGSDYFGIIKGPFWARSGEKVTLEVRMQATETAYGMVNCEVWVK